MIIFLYGTDDYRSRKKLKEIINRYKEIYKSGLNLEFLGGKNLDFQDFKKTVETIPMFQEKKLIVLKEVFSNKNFQKEFLKERKKFVNSKNIILIYEKEVDKNNPFFKFLKENSQSQEFRPLEGRKLWNWAKAEFKKYQTEIEDRALERLINFIGNDLWQLSNEIKKLATFKSGHNLNEAESKIYFVGLKDVELLVRPKIEIDIFKTIDAIALRNKKRALELLHRHLEKGDSPLYLLSMINFQFRNLILIRELIEKKQPYYSILRKTKLHPFLISKSYQQAQRFSLSELKNIYLKIFQTELNIKTGKIDPATALDLFIGEL